MRAWSILMVLSLFSMGCASQVMHTVAFDPHEPLRVAVLPFAQVDESGMVVSTDPELWLDSVSLVSSKLRQPPARFVQKVTVDELSRSGLDLIPGSVVGSKLVHFGFGIEHEFDLPKIRRAAPKDLCALLGCDALLYGTLTRWDRSYYAVQSVSSIGLELRLVRASDGMVLFSSTASDSESRGVSKVPTGFSDLVLEPIRGLDNDIIADLARRLVRQMTEPLRVEQRPAVLRTAAPAIIAVAQTAFDGEVSRHRPLTVVLSGTPGARGFFSVGEVFQNVPMIEREPGHYFGELYVLPTDHFSKQPLQVVLVDAFGREARTDLQQVLLTLP